MDNHADKGGGGVVTKMVYPMEDGLKLEVEMEWDDMVLPGLARVYEDLIRTFSHLANGGGRGWGVDTRPGKRESIAEGMLPAEDDADLHLAETCSTAPAFVRDAPELARLARRLCRLADWAGAVRGKAMDAWVECARNGAFVEAAMGSIAAQLGLLAELERTRAVLYKERNRPEEAKQAEATANELEKRWAARMAQLADGSKASMELLARDNQRRERQRGHGRKRGGQSKDAPGAREALRKLLESWAKDPEKRKWTHQALIEEACRCVNKNRAKSGKSGGLECG